MSDRNIAQRMDRDVGPLIRAGNRAATKLGQREMNRGIKEFRKGGVIGPGTLVVDLTPLLVDALMLGYLFGKRRTALLTPSMELAISAFRSALKFLKRKVVLSTTELNEITTFYQTNALRVATQVSDKVEKALQRSMVKIGKQGLSTRDGVKELRRAYAAQGITPRNSFTLEAVFRTQIQLAYSAGRWEGEQDPAIQEILWGYKYVTVGDSRVRESHVLLEGTTLPKDDPFWDVNRPPNGWACRCQAIPLFEKRRIQQPKSGGEADKEFQFNPGTVLNPKV